MQTTNNQAMNENITESTQDANPEETKTKRKYNRKTNEERIAEYTAKITEKEQELAKEKARRQKLINIEKKKQRTADTKQKIILGSWILALFKKMKGVKIGNPQMDIETFLEHLSEKPMPELLKAWIAEQKGEKQ